MNPTAPIDVFIAYSKADKAFLDDLVTQLRSVERIGLIDAWHDGEIEVGSNREEAILQAMQEAEIVLLLISADFLASEFAYEKEIKVAKMLHKEGKAVMIPIIIRDCAWQYVFPDESEQKMVLPRNQVPINNRQWDTPDQAFKEVVDAVVQTSEKIRRGQTINSIEPTPSATTQREKTITISKTVHSNSKPVKEESKSIWKYLIIGLVLMGLIGLVFPMLNSSDKKEKRADKEKSGIHEQTPNRANDQRTTKTTAEQRVPLPFVQIGQLDWMRQNLSRALPKENWCPNESEADCSKCGRYYTFESALRACPQGWRLPSQAEWSALGQDDFKRLGIKACGFYNKATIQVGIIGHYWSGERSGGETAWGFKFKDFGKNRVDRLFTHFGANCRCVAERH
ncbi:MAG: FISUMP domain-containing protein [Bacteroidota bacterium]